MVDSYGLTCSGMSLLSTGREAVSSDFLWRVLDCAKEYLDRQSGRSFPAGRFDSESRFFLDDLLGCCADVRCPSLAYPYSQHKHGRSLLHVLNEFELENHLEVIQTVAEILRKNGKGAAIAFLNKAEIKRALIQADLGV